jgi:hypothetical protein
MVFGLYIMQYSGPTERKPRLLFTSYHCYQDPSSGAALCTRELLELLARRDWCCRVLSGPHLDFEQNPSLAQLLTDQEIAFEEKVAMSGTVPIRLYRFEQGGVPVQVYDSPVGRPSPSASREASSRCTSVSSSDFARRWC